MIWTWTKHGRRKGWRYVGEPSAWQQQHHDPAANFQAMANVWEFERRLHRRRKRPDFHEVARHADWAVHGVMTLDPVPNPMCPNDTLWAILDREIDQAELARLKKFEREIGLRGNHAAR